MVRPILEYSSTARVPYTQENASKLEKVQRSAARFVKKVQPNHLCHRPIAAANLIFYKKKATASSPFKLPRSANQLSYAAIVIDI